ncbi:transglutaminase-like cysteine peptidase [Flaviflagellibacter deserti]|uniref:Transglutaminase-like cysteine peptidase n=1 Tax=Flaviflagellibacter deserti TaxID=2267266 RepID=A0ABV9Z7F7_9HYPH
MFIRKREVFSSVFTPTVLLVSLTVGASGTDIQDKAQAEDTGSLAASQNDAQLSEFQAPEAGTPDLAGMQGALPQVARLGLKTTAPQGGVFASIAFRVGAKSAKPRIPAALGATADLQLPECGEMYCPSDKDDVLKAVETALGQSLEDKLFTVNSFVNRTIAYKSDNEVYGSLDHWSKPDETLSRGKGDCEDFALLKMAALRAAGVPDDSMTLVVLRDTRRNLFHAVLSVATDKGNFILDNVRDAILPDSSLPQYRALYSMNDRGTWIHGYPSDNKEAAGRTSIEAVQPGEGTERKS